MFSLRKSSEEKVILLFHVTAADFPQPEEICFTFQEWWEVPLLAELGMEGESEWLFIPPRWPAQHWWEELWQWWLAHLGTGKSCGTKKDFRDHKVLCLNDGKVEGETGSALLPSKQNWNVPILKYHPDLAVRGKLVGSPRPWPGWAFGDRSQVGHHQDVDEKVRTVPNPRRGIRHFRAEELKSELLLLVSADGPPAGLFTSPPLLILEFKQASWNNYSGFFEELLMRSLFKNKQLFRAYRKDVSVGDPSPNVPV